MPIYDKVPRVRVNGENMSSKGYLRRQVWTHPAVGAVDAIHAAITLGAAAADVVTGITNPDFPRTLTIKPTKAGAGAITGDVVITGTDIRGNVVTDTIACSTDTTVVEGVVAFKTVTKIHVPARTSASDAIEIGTGTKLGLDRACAGNERINATVDGTVEATAPIITANTAISKNVVLINTALAATKVYVLNYIATEVTASRATTA